MLALFVLSTLIWDVRVEGNSVIPEEKIRQAARAEGIYGYQWSFRLANAVALSQRLALRLPEAAWVGVDRSGTSITITVVESTKPEVKALEGPRHLVAKTDAVITRIIAENGRPQVERNDRVRKGDILISGVLGNGTNIKQVVSKGKVMGLVWHEYRISSPLQSSTRNLTGESTERGYLVIGNRALQISGYGASAFERSQIRTTINKMQLWNKILPFGTMKEHEQEVVEIGRKLTSRRGERGRIGASESRITGEGGQGCDN